MKEVLRIHGGSLRSLESRDSMEEFAGTLVEYCSGGQLEELGIRVSPSSQGLLAGPIGEGLKHLQLAMGWSQSLPAVTQNILWLKERIEQGTSLRSLETLTLVESNLSTANRRQGFSLQAIVSANQIRDAFTSKGVNLFIKGLFRTEELEIKYPLVDPLNFPRKPSILDYRAMSAVSGLIPQLHAVAS
ncbi:hypothetical protein FRC02_000562 [Tulasnella sp. 418]|nr:hypothetical protein FRC02_000562 [Tulasnella sp. 418]